MPIPGGWKPNLRVLLARVASICYVATRLYTVEMSADRYSKLQERYESMTDRLLGSGNANGVTAPPKPKKRPKSTAEIRSRATEIVDDHDRRLRLINDHMWQHRQEGRELKRLEMDYTRTQRNLKTAMQAKERDVEKRKAIEERRLLEKQMMLQRYEQHDLHQAFDSTRTKTKGIVEATTRNNEAIKKQIKATNKNEYAFEKLCEAVDRKRAEVQKLSEEFELKIRRKEEEQFLLQKKLAEVAITLNMEAHKKRKEEADSISHRAKEMMKELREKRNREDTLGEERRKAELAGRQYEERKKELAKNLRQEKERMELKGRETGRKLGDVRRMLAKNTEMQTFAVTASEHVEGTRMLSDMEEKMRRVEEKRKAAVEAKAMEAMQKNGKGFDEWERRMSKQQNDIARKEHEDRIRSLVKDVQRQDEIERR